MRCHYIGNNNFLNSAVVNLFSLTKERHACSFNEKIVYFVDTESVLTVRELVNQIIKILKIERKACIVLIENNHFVASVHTSDRVSIESPISEWINSVYAVMPNIDEILSSCMNVLKLHGLTEAQKRFFLHLKTGKSLRQISKKLFISNKTAYAHRKVIKELFSFSSSAHLIIYIKNEYH